MCATHTQILILSLHCTSKVPSVTRGGINYLNLSDLPPFLGPLSLSSNLSLSSFSLYLPSCEHTSLHLNFSLFFLIPRPFLPGVLFHPLSICGFYSKM